MYFMNGDAVPSNLSIFIDNIENGQPSIINLTFCIVVAEVVVDPVV